MQRCVTGSTGSGGSAFPEGHGSAEPQAEGEDRSPEDWASQRPRALSGNYSSVPQGVAGRAGRGSAVGVGGARDPRAPTAASSRPVLGAASGARRRGRRKTAFSVTGSSEQGTEGNESPAPRQGRRALRSLRPRGRVPGRGRIPGTAKGSQATPRLTQQAAGARPRCLGPAAGVSGLAPTRHR